MPLLCPECHQPLDRLCCPNEHRYCEIEGVTVLVAPSRRPALERFVTAVETERGRVGKRLLDPKAYPELPAGAAVQGNFEWRLRRYDLSLIRQLLAGRQGQRVLDVGAWNGWLSNQLTADGHTVTAVDYFRDPYDGLGALRFFRHKWRAIQLDLVDLSPLGEQFDLIVLNRCLPFFPDPAGYVDHIRQLVRPGGLCIATGLPWHRRIQSRRDRVTALQRAFTERYGIDLFLRPTRALLEDRDRQELTDRGMVLRRYRALWGAELRSLFMPERPYYRYGILRA